MTALPPIYISLTAYGKTDVRRHGQLWYAQVAQRAGADGIEVRGELLADADAELPVLAQFAREHALAVVYSSPDPVWRPGGVFNASAVALALDRARIVGAARVKMSIGNFDASAAVAAATAATGGRGEALAELGRLVAASGAQLVIENDPTEPAGTRVALERFFAAADAAGLDLPMTFDIANWHWAGECPMQMAALFGARVRYLHCKGAQRLPQKWVAVPLADSVSPWRAIIHAMPTGIPWAIEYPLAGEDLVAITREQIEFLRAAARHQQG